MRTLLGACRSAPTLLCTAAIAALLFAGAETVRGVEGANGWDVTLPVLGDGKVLGLCVPLWLAVVVVGTGRRMTDDATLLRDGSRLRALRAGLGDLLLRMLGLALMVGLVALPLTAGAGTAWSDFARVGRPGVDAGAFATQRLSEVFPGPAPALVALVLQAALAAVALGAAHLALLLVGRPRLATGVLLGVVIWSALCSFGIGGSGTPLDPVAAFDLFWAMRNGLALPAVVACVGVLGAAMLLCRRADSSAPAPVGALLRRPSALAVLLVVAGLLAVGTATAEPRADFAELWAAFFAGANGSVVSWAQLLLITAGAATWSVARLEARRDQLFAVEAIRLGSQRAWLGRALGTELLLVAGYGVAVPALVAAVFAALRPSGWTAVAVIGPLASVSALLVLQLTLLVLLGGLSVLLVGSTAAWYVVVAATAALGYRFVVDLGPWNVFALPSSDPRGSVVVTGGAVLAAVSAGGLGLVLFAGAARSRLRITPS